MNSMLVNWKTSLAGVVLIVVGLIGTLLDIHIPGFTMDAGAAITMGLGLLLARDGSAPNVVKILVAALAISLFLPRGAVAGDIASPAAMAPIFPIKLPAKVPAGSPCTPTSCSGWYVGAGLGGIGTNLNVIGNGLNGSAFAGGMLPTLKTGYLYAQNGWLFGAELTAAYQTNTTTTVAGSGGNQNGMLLTQGVKFGGNFSQLLGQTTSPITIPPALANAVINIYGQAGTAQHQLVGGFASGEYGGAGVLFDTGPHSFVDIDYKNIQYGATKNGGASFNSENVITASFNYKF